MSYGDDYDTGERGIPSQTRTHLPDDPGAEPRRGGASARRSLSTVVGVVLVLIAAIVFANRADDGGGSPAERPEEARPGGAPTAPSGEAPVPGTGHGVPAGFPATEQGAESAAANYAVALGGEEMFRTESRQAVVAAVYAPDAAARQGPELDRVYADADFLGRVGLTPDGTAPAGMTFVSRVIPVGTKLVEFEETTAVVEVWYTSLFGMAGEGSTNPVTEAWYTNIIELTWLDGDWKVVDFEQVEGPVPVGRDQRASTAEEMAEASEQFGGFTYAR
jgi:hypothetical protein